MKVIEILMQGAILLNMQEISTLLQTADEENQEQLLANQDIKTLFDLLKYSVQELCTNYVPLIDEKKITTNERQYPLSNFENYIRIQKVLKNGVLVKHKIINRNIVLAEDGEYEVVFERYPSIVSLFEDIDFLERFSPDVIVIGLCAYYSLSKGMFEDFEKFHEKYEEKAYSLRNVKIFNTPQRRWL